METQIQSKKRLENGLIEGIEYPYDTNGRIDWFKLVPNDCLYINPAPKRKIALEKRLCKPFEEIQKSEVKNTDLVITLQGIRHLLDLRGYKRVNTKLDYCGPDYAAATCEIVFLSNTEENFEQTFTASACAHRENTSSFMKTYLVEAATNRAFCRAVRQFLRVSTVSNEELGDGDEKGASSESDGSIPENPMDPRFLLKRIIETKNKDLPDDQKITFQTIKDKLISEKKVKNAEKFEAFDDIPKDVIFSLIDRINNMKIKK